jgi:hypothetical protein
LVDDVPEVLARIRALSRITTVGTTKCVYATAVIAIAELALPNRPPRIEGPKNGAAGTAAASANNAAELEFRCNKNLPIARDSP